MTNARDSSSGVPIRPIGHRARPRRLFALILLAGSLCAIQAPGAPPEGLPPPDTTLIAGAVSLGGAGEVLPAPARPIRAGEYLKFSVRYGFISAGDAYLEIPEVRMWKGRPVYHLVARAESNKFFSTFYKVRNRIESLWDTTGFYSRRFYENRREGGYHEENEITFDYKRGEAVYANDGQTIAIPQNCQDALSSFYFTRTQDLPLGGSVIFDYHASHRSQPIEVKVLGRQRIETPAGTFNCIVIEPILRAAGIFKNQGRLVIWLTDDDRRMPVMMKSKVTIGSISVVLTEARRG
jgi:uncharacterized protein DUF3108